MRHEENEWCHIIQNTPLVPFSCRKNKHTGQAREQHICPWSVDWDTRLRKLTVCRHVKEDVCEEVQQVHSGSRASHVHAKLSRYIWDVAARHTLNQDGNRFLSSTEADCMRIYPIWCLQKVLNQWSSFTQAASACTSSCSNQPVSIILCIPKPVSPYHLTQVSWQPTVVIFWWYGISQHA